MYQESLANAEARQTSFVYKRISILVQRFNAVLLYMTVCRPLAARIEDRTYFSYFSFNF